MDTLIQGYETDVPNQNQLIIDEVGYRTEDIDLKMPRTSQQQRGKQLNDNSPAFNSSFAFTPSYLDGRKKKHKGQSYHQVKMTQVLKSKRNMSAHGKKFTRNESATQLRLDHTSFI